MTERIHKHIILGEIMEESGGPDVARGEVWGRSLLCRFCVSSQTDRQAGGQTDRVRTH